MNALKVNSPHVFDRHGASTITSSTTRYFAVASPANASAQDMKVPLTYRQHASQRRGAFSLGALLSVLSLTLHLTLGSRPCSVVVQGACSLPVQLNGCKYKNAREREESGSR